MGYSFLDSAFAPEIPAHTPGDAKEGNQNHGGAVPLSCQLLLLGEEEWFSAWAVSSYWSPMAWHTRRGPHVTVISEVGDCW